MNEVYIVSMARTPIGSFGGDLSALSAIELGSKAIEAAVRRSGLAFDQIQEVYMGNVLSANLGQAPARQAAIGAGLQYEVPCTTVNKVCASGMKAIMLAAQSIMTAQQDIVVAGGMESMSNVPYYIPKARFGYNFGNGSLVDGLAHDGLMEAYYGFPMGNCADNTAKSMDISREEQDDYAISSYTRAAKAWEGGLFKDEVISVDVPGRKGQVVTVTEDEAYTQVDFGKIRGLKPVFANDGTVTAANASTLNDGASAVVLMSKKKAQSMGIPPLARILGFADAATDPLWFTTAPSLAIPKALNNAGVAANSVDYYEINEAFAAVAIANQRQLGLEMDRLNVFGGAVALGHPLGCSGARITNTLYSVLKANNGTIGVAGICNGGGGASAIVLERVN
nr:acetyl-CoA C-acyltransferase [Cytophagales bacterium]